MRRLLKLLTIIVLGILAGVGLPKLITKIRRRK